MNKFKKYCPNVWVAECEEAYRKGDIISLITKYGKEVQCKVFNLVSEKNGLFYYSIIRVEEQTYAERKVEKYKCRVSSHLIKSNQYYRKSQEGREFLSLGEPIKIGHHSEKRHRNLISRNNARMDKCVEFAKKAEEAERKADYWESKLSEITLAMPESIAFYKFKLDKAIENHRGLKDGTIQKVHAYSLQYAAKEVKELTKKLEIATILWR